MAFNADFHDVEKY